MLRSRMIRTMIPATLAALLLTLNGCFQESPVGPDASDDAPALPSPERLTFDFSFFQAPSTIDRASHDHFFNAYIRATVAGAVTHLVLVPPVTAFSLALHTVPTPQEDGSYLWIYTWNDGTDEVQVRLRGTPLASERVAWEMRVSSTIEGYDNDLWFAGETWNDGEGGEWAFHDPDRGGVHTADLVWGADADGNYLRFIDAIDNVGDSLEYREDGALHAFTFTDADQSDLSWYVKWDEVVGSGSLRAPDYNGGTPSCWDEHQIDSDCPAS
jgi:hypothetical protein